MNQSAGTLNCISMVPRFEPFDYHLSPLHRAIRFRATRFRQRVDPKKRRALAQLFGVARVGERHVSIKRFLYGVSQTRRDRRRMGNRYSSQDKNYGN
jgi:hypothetical protein